MKITLPDGVVLKEFKPCAFYHKEMDMVTFLSKDCSYRAENNPNTLIQILYDAHTEEPIGFNIECPKAFISQVIKERGKR